MNAINVSKHNTFLLLAICAMAVPTAQAQVADTSKWICEFCPFEDGQRSDLSLGASVVSDDSAYFGDASGYSEAGTYANVDGIGSFAGENHWLKWQIENLGLDSRYAGLSGGRQGTFDYNVAYRQIPRFRYFTSDTIFLQSAADSLSLPTGWVRAPNTSGFTELDANLQRRNIESERKILDLGGTYLPTSRMSFSADFRRQEQNGVGLFGGSYYTQSSLLPGSFDYVTDVIDLGVRYAGDNGFLSLKYYASLFDNANTELRWESPFTTAPGAEVAAMAQAPDNTYQQLSLSGNYGFSNHKTVASFSVALGRMEQDDAFLPYTTNANLPVNPLARSSLDAKVDTSNFSLALSSNVLEKARVKLSYRFDERDNQTEQDNWSRIITDTFISGELESNIPYSFERSELNLSADYKLFESVRVSGGYDRKTVDRDFQEVAEQTEDSGWGQIRWRPNRTWDIDLTAGASQRNIDRYNETFAETLGQNPLLRKYNLAYRYRRFGEFTVSAAKPDSPVSITVNGMYADDEYTQSQLGLSAGDDLRLAADLSWVLSGNASLYLNGGYESMSSEQFGSAAFASPDWRGTNDDTFVTASAGFRIRQIGDRFGLQMDYTRSDGTSEIEVASGGGGLSQFPDLKSTLDFLRLKVTYSRSNQLEFTMNLRYQKFSAEDWALEGVGPATIPVVLTLGAKPYDDEVVIFGLGFRYLIGAAAAAPSK